MKRTYSTPPTIVRTSESEYTHLDLNAYRRFRDTMERHGYRFLSDIRVLGISDTPRSPMAPTMIRAMVSADGVTCAGYYQVKPKLERRVLSLLAGLLTLRFIADLRGFLQSLTGKECCDFESELGSNYVVTSNAEDAATIGLPRAIDSRFFPYGTTVDELRTAHEARLRGAAQGSGAKPTSMTTIEQVIAMEVRLQERKNAFRAASNWITQNELRTVAGGNTALADEIFEEVQTVLSQPSKSPPDAP